MASRWDGLSVKDAKEFGKFLEHQELYPETIDDLLFSYNVYCEKSKDAIRCCKSFHLLHALKACGFISNWEGIYITWKSWKKKNVHSKAGKIVDDNNLQFQGKMLTASSKMSIEIDTRSAGVEKEMDTRLNEHGTSDQNCDAIVNERIVWEQKKDLTESPSRILDLPACPEHENEGIGMPNIRKKIPHSLPVRYVPLKKMQSINESQISKASHSEESLKAGSRYKNSISNQRIHGAVDKTQTSEDRFSDKNVERQSEKSVVSRAQTATNVGKNENLIMNGKMKGTGECHNRVEVGGCKLEKHTGKTIENKKGSKDLMQGNPNGSHTYSRKMAASREPPSRIDYVSSVCSLNTEEIKDLHRGKKGANTYKQRLQIERKKAIIEHGTNQLEDCKFKSNSASNKTTVHMKGGLNQGIDRFENAKEIGGNAHGSHGRVGRQTYGGATTSLGLAEIQDEISEELEGGAICVSFPFPFENAKPQSINSGGVGTAAISIVNNGKTSVNLLAVNLVNSRPSNSFSLSLISSAAQKSVQCNHGSCLASMTSFKYGMKSVSKFQTEARSLSLVGGMQLIEPGHHIIVILSCTAKDIGLHRSSILFDFEDQKIIRHAIVLGEDEVSKQLGPIGPYCRHIQRKKLHRFYRFVPGVPPSLPAFGKRIGNYFIPNNLKKNVGKKLPRVLEQGLSMGTYTQYFSTLLYLEELRLKADIGAYDMHNVTMSNRSGYLVLKVPGLLERRPSLIYRDRVYVTTSQTKKKKYEGYIYKIEADEILVKFHRSLHEKFIPNLRFDVQFSFSRINLRRCHQAVEAAGAMPENFLFPCKHLTKMACENVAEIVPFNTSLNIEQLSAVHQIMNHHGSPPYLLYGPPGTGKTVTIVETICQILERNSNAHILACAPSNSASDLLLERLYGPVQQRDILRLNAYTRPYDDVSSAILPCCSYDDHSSFCCPPVEVLMKYKVIISTYLSAAMLDAQELPTGHFTYIFLDESGQGTEPETMVPIANLATRETTVVLAGDPQQLGPIVHSPMAEKFGLGKSYLERLSELEFYSLDRGNKESITKLVRNYRSHPAILEIPSRLFYGGELIACATNLRQISFCGWEELPDMKFPVIFVGIEGCEERESASPSWFNAIEVSKVIEIITKFRDNKRSQISGGDVGVITPYQRQVVKLKKALDARSLSDIKVGSVEQFQGDERHVIIISTVRSTYKNQESDEKYNLEFLRNPKRFNVAVTRAKSLLVVVGNPYILSKDKHWNELLQYCVCHKSYIGCSLP